MAPDTMDDNSEELRPSQNAHVDDIISATGYSKSSALDNANGNRSNKQGDLGIETQNAQIMDLIHVINEPKANIGGEHQPALSITLPEFNPEGEEPAASAWCNQVDICFGKCPLQGGALIMALSNSLKGSASSWLPQVTYEGMTWAEFKINFLACYDSQNTCAATMISINNSRPKEDESYAAYASRLVHSFLTRWKGLTPEEITVSFVLAHISGLDPRIKRMAFTTEILTLGKLVHELTGFSYLKHKLQPYQDENIDLSPEKRVKGNVSIQRLPKKRKSAKAKTAMESLSQSAELAPKLCYKLQPNLDENVLKVRLVKTTETIQHQTKKRKSAKLKTATATSNKPMDVMPEICHCCGKEGHNAICCPIKSAFPVEPEPGSSGTAQHHVDTEDSGCVCCGPQPVTGTLRRLDTMVHTELRVKSPPEITNSTICIDLETEDTNHIIEKNAEGTANIISRLGSSSETSNNTIYIEIDSDKSQISNETNGKKNTDKYFEDLNQNVTKTNLENEAIRVTDVYAELVLLEQRALVPNAEEIECGVCMDNYQPGQGAVLRECVHTFCKECLADVVKHSEEPAVSCPAMGCPGLLQQREIRALVSPEDYERWLAKGLAAAESGARNSFHCRTTDCKGWAMCDPEVTKFLCPVCSTINCVTCQAIHENDTCEEYHTKKKSDKKTEIYLDNLLSRGEAMQCPECSVIITKQLGCDWIKCTACKTEICWATRGRRWGPRGRGDTSAGCRCKVNRKKCHPSCRDCH